MTERFNVNNKELNKKKFENANLHIIKGKLLGKAKGAKFIREEISFSLTP